MDVSGARPRVDLHIEELVLHGFAPGDRYRIAEAVQRELTVLLAQPEATRGRFQRTAKLDRLDTGAMTIPDGASTSAIGARIAGAVYRGLMR